MDNGFAFDILIFAALAGFLLLRLRNVLGQRTGNERSIEEANGNDSPSAGDNDNIVSLPERLKAADLPDDPLAAGIIKVKMADSNFDERSFAEGAKGAFSLIVKAFAVGDLDSLRPLLSTSLYGGFAAAIQDREDAGLFQDTAVSIFLDAQIVAADIEHHDAVVTIKFVTEQIKITRDGDGKIIDGDPDHAEKITDIWTFRRNTQSSDPNWQLTQTRSPDVAAPDQAT
jgi:predicted lipid-binding transport protein (Tim44 family)